MVELEALSLPTFASDRPLRPPTPPRESSFEEQRSGPLDIVLGTAKRLFRRTSSITTTTPQSSAESPETPSGSIRKRVEWGEVTENNVPNLSVPGNQIFFQSEKVRTLTPSIERKPSKSILKHNPNYALGESPTSTNSTNLASPQATTFATMLESVTKQLAGTDRTAKVDAYLALSAALRASENVPDMRALKSKVEILLSFVKRDMTDKGEGGKVESSLTTNALVLLCSFFHTTTLAEIIPSEFAIYLVELSIKTFEDQKASKEFARHLMFVMAKQNFSSKIMNQERVGRLVKALHNIESGNLTGKRMVDGRISIYRSLIRQSRSHMLVHHLWIQDLFTDMASKLKETRAHAIEFGLEAAYSFGMEVKVTRIVSTLFESEFGEKGKYGAIFIARLKHMLQDDNEKDYLAPAAVPQIWSVFILFFRSRIQLLEKWEFFLDWLKLISEAFNGSNQAARKEALLAWNRFIFAVYSNEQQSLGTSTTPTLTRLLLQALEGQLRRNNLRTQSFNTLCCLLYYSSPSVMTPDRLDAYWKDIVTRLIGGLIPADVSINPKKAKISLAEACSVLQWLFDHNTSRSYNENRILENVFHVNELPPLESKWLRKSAAIVFPLVGGLLEKLFWELGEKSDVNSLWQNYVKSISSPAAKEIKVANDTMTSVASVFGFLYRVWNAGPKGLKSLPRQESEASESAAFLNSFDHIITTLLAGLGHLPFVDRQLCIGTQDTFIPIATPSQRPGKIRGEIKTPFHHLITLLTTASPNLAYDQSFTRLVQHVLAPFYECRKTKSSQIELSKSILEMLPAENSEPCRIIWQVVAIFTASVVDTRDPGNGANRDQPLGATYKDLVKVLEYGLDLARNDPLTGWKSLFDAIACSATLDAGDSGKAIAVIEPLSISFQKKDPPLTTQLKVSHFNVLVGKVSYPKDRQALDVAGKKMWGVVSSVPKGSFDPYVRLYEFIQGSLESSYDSFDKQKQLLHADMISAVTGLLIRCPPVLCYGLLASIQTGVGLWAQDSGLKYSSGDKLFTAVSTLWDRILDTITRLHQFNAHSELLSDFEGLLCSGLESRQKATINRTIKFWNSSFGTSEQELKYPDRLRDILLRLRAMTEIQLPSLPASLASDLAVDGGQPITFEESQFDPGSMFNVSGLSSILRGRPASTLSPNATPRITMNSSSLKRSREETPITKGRKSRKREITPKLRHDDSQIQFQPINSSPLADRVVDSQVLTDRQREVKERQQADAGMFHNIGSSPVRRSRSVEGDPELPVHRSSSQLRSEPRDRVPTPTLITPSEDDGFVPSSPTPTRSIRGEVDQYEPPSSPPQPASDIVHIFDGDIPSSPPEVAEEPEINSPVSSPIDPPVQQQLPVSTYGSTVDFDGVLSAPKPVIVTENEDHESDIDIGSNEDPAVNLLQPPERGTARSRDGYEVVDEVEETMLESPGTPKRSKQVPVPSTPRTSKEAFVDARTSPSSSDKADEDVFEDAVSSPRLHIAAPFANPISSSLSAFDESSILRALAEVEDQQPKQATSPAILQEDQAFQPQAPPEQQTEQATPVSKNRPWSWKTPLFRPDLFVSGKSSVGFKLLSSNPSHIPETPAPGVLPISAKLMVGNQALNPDDTIFVDDSILHEAEETPETASKSRFGSKIPSRKRKYDGEVANSQESVREGSVSSQASSKRPRGRPRKYPRASQEFDTSVELGTSPSPAILEGVEEDSKTPQEDLNMSQGSSLDPLASLVVDAAVAEVADEEPSGSPAENATSFDVVGETLLDESSFLEINQPQSNDESISAAPKQEAQVPSNTVTDPITTSDEVSMQIIEETRIMSPSSATPEPVKSTTEIVREHMRALMESLETGSIARKDVHEIEDLFMDAKELLYGAARRGRKK